MINPTEALVSIDINSGRSTREHNIEQTAYATNIEAAHEIARQLRLRDMAGLVVIDFIDMESNGHVRKVEKAMKDALKNDRARIQVGRISSFGLMEMSRQRLRTGVLEASTKPCPHCEGTGLMRTAASAGLSALRMVEEEAARGRGSLIVLRAGREAAVYVLNKKRHQIAEVEQRYGVLVEIVIDESFEGAKMTVESVGPPPVERPRPQPLPAPADDEEDLVEEEEEEEEEEEREEEREPRGERGRPERSHERGEGDQGRKRRRRRGRRGGRRREGEGREEGEQGFEGHEGEGEDRAPAEAASGAETASLAEDRAAEKAEQDEQPRKSRRRPRARKRGEGETAADESARSESAPLEASAPVEDAPQEPAVSTEAAPAPEAAVDEAAPAKPKRSRRKKADAEVESIAPAAEVSAPVEAPAAAPEAANDAEAAKPKRRSRAKAPAKAPAAPEGPVLERQAEPASTEAGEASAESESGAESGPLRRGWWQRTFGG